MKLNKLIWKKILRVNSQSIVLQNCVKEGRFQKNKWRMTMIRMHLSLIMEEDNNKVQQVLYLVETLAFNPLKKKLHFLL